MRVLVPAALTAVLVLAVACGDPECDGTSDCAPVATATMAGARSVATTPMVTPQRTPAIPVEAEPTRPLATPDFGSPSPEPPTTTVSPVPPTPTITPTLIPSPPGSLPTQPAGPAPTPATRARFPDAGDLKQRADGTYYARVDGCDWAETLRRRDSPTGEETVILRSDCYDDEWVEYYPGTGEVRYWVT